ncbi:hypothetical protein E8D34_04790 [Nocardioides sp. GY 10113]|uniref:hypothetical protein n=1 Tax=Nocardioides sp. GY 10113 TaxID=2569761 RepID=UPI0010A7BCED|nr:hypothetical protein [Nocardioides sp. GY 10113]TIC88260.1 hypothetical protein E8D34_04790 [Nocardioides sp. GY 10113]
MARLSKKKKLLGVIAAAALVTGGGTAYAYWTSGGAGTGSGTTTASIAPVVVNQTSTVSDLRPGGTPVTLAGTFTNPNGSPAYVAAVTVSIGSVTKAAGAPAGACDASDYTLTNTVMPVGAEIPAGTSKGAWSGATIAFNNKATTNQDGCKGATVTLAYAVS